MSKIQENTITNELFNEWFESQIFLISPLNSAILDVLSVTTTSINLELHEKLFEIVEEIFEDDSLSMIVDQKGIHFFAASTGEITVNELETQQRIYEVYYKIKDEVYREFMSQFN